jgi:TolB-like protein
MNLHRLGPELQRRKVWRTAVAYASAAVVIALAIAELYDVLLLPDWTPRLVVALLVAGLPIAVALSWAYDVRPEPAAPAVPGAQAAVAVQVTAGPGGAASGEAAIPVPSAVSARVGDRSIVVLPFDNLSPDPDNEYFSDGLTEEIISDLSRLRSLRVISRTSAMLLKGCGKDVRTIGRELSVRYVLEGSVRRAGDRLRVTAQLIDAASDAHLWAERYDGVVGDVFGIQEDMARSIALALRIELSPEEEKSLASAPVQDTHTYECVLRARHAIWTGTGQSLRSAMAYLEEALRVGGENALVLGALGEARFMYPHVAGEGMEDLPERLSAIAERIQQVDPSAAAGHLVSGLALQKTPWRIAEALHELRAASRLAPSDTSALLFHAFVAGYVGCEVEARAVLDRLLELDPLSPLVQLNRGYMLSIMGDAGQAVVHARAGFRADPGNAYYGAFLMFVLAQAGLVDEATDVVSTLPDPPSDNFGRAAALFAAALQGRSLDPYLADGLLAAARHDEWFSLILAQCFARAARAAEAFGWLENTMRFGLVNTRFLCERDPLLAPLREYSLFVALLTKARAITAPLAHESATVAVRLR